MTIDEAITRALEVANRGEMCVTLWKEHGRESTQKVQQCIEDHRQLAEWLTELKERREQTRGHWINEGPFASYHGGNVYRCSKCGAHIVERSPDDFCKFCGSDNREL